MRGLEAQVSCSEFRLAKQVTCIPHRCISTRGSFKARAFDIEIKVFVAARRVKRRSTVQRILKIIPKKVRVGRVVISVGKSWAEYFYNVALGSLKSRIQATLEATIEDNLKGMEEAVSLNMEFLPIVILAIMEAE